jgi:hypothetical protein
MQWMMGQGEKDRLLEFLGWDGDDWDGMAGKRSSVLFQARVRRDISRNSEMDDGIALFGRVACWRRPAISECGERADPCVAICASSPTSMPLLR